MRLLSEGLFLFVDSSAQNMNLKEKVSLQLPQDISFPGNKLLWHANLGGKESDNEKYTYVSAFQIQYMVRRWLTRLECEQSNN